jgi:hypothetical protein
MLLDRFERVAASVAPVDGLVELTLRVALVMCRGTRAALLLPDDGKSEAAPLRSRSRRVVGGDARRISVGDPAAMLGVINIPLLAGDAAVGWLRIEGAALTSPRVVDRLRRFGQRLARVLQVGLEPGEGRSPSGSIPRPRALCVQARKP